MSFRKRGYKRRPDPSQMVNWLIAGVVLLAFVHHMFGGSKGAAPLKQSVQTAADNISAKNPVKIDQMKSKIFPGQQATLRVQDVKAGSGAPVVCGQKVSVAYKTFLDDGKAIDDGADKEKPLTFTIGDNNVMPAFDEGLIGMKEGGTRNLFAPPHMAYGLPQFANKDVPDNSTVQFEVELLDVTPKLPTMNETPYRIADVQHGIGRIFHCGEPVRVHATVWTTEGKKLFSSHDAGQKPLAFIPGKSQVFIGLEQGVIGLREGGVRTVIVPPVFQKTMQGNEPAFAIPLPENQTVLVDIESVP